MRLLPLLTVLLVSTAVSVQAQPPEPKQVLTPQQVISSDVNEFVKGLNGNNPYFESAPYVAGVRLGYYGGPEWGEAWTKQRSGSMLIVEKVDVLTLEGDDASANITYYWQANLFRSAPTTETLNLRRSTAPNGRRTIWQIVVSPAAVEATKAPLVPSTPILAYAASQIFTPEPDPVTTQSLQAISRLKQLGLGALMLAMDYDEIYAFYPQYAEKALYPYLKDNDLWKVPGQSSKFSFNASLSGLTLAKLAEPARTVAFYEGEDEKPVFRYAGKAAIGFADGHTVLVSPEELKGVIWKP